MNDANYWIDRLRLQRHPEGGYFRETYRASDTIPAAGLPPRFVGERAFSTLIYFLLPGMEYSALHRIRSDEVWHFYSGSSLTIHVIDADGGYAPLQFGSDSFQAVVPAGCWFGATVDDPDSYALVGCTMAPGFDFADFELGRRDHLIALYPRHRALIERLTKPEPGFA
jgi:predicted cupin superfamily sugar epimerase